MADNLPVTQDEGSEDAVPAAECPPAVVAHVPDGDDLPPWSSSTGELHLASRLDFEGVAARDDAVVRLLVSADLRDAAAGCRDSEARLLPPWELATTAGISREWAARDRDLAAADRADLVSLLRAREARTTIPRPR